MIAASLALLAWTAHAAPALVDCDLETFGLGRTRAKCGAVQSGAFSIGFAVLTSTADKKRPDPVVVLPGGPGQASTELAAFFERGFDDILRERDIILFDPRGTGRSHKLVCKDDRTLAARLRASKDEERAFLAACASSLDVDLKSITTAAFVDDLEAVRTALGVDTWNLVGISYGTRLGLAYDRAHPGKARTLVLDSVVPFSMAVGEGAADDALASLQALDARAPSKDGATLVDIARELRRTFNEAPRDVSLPHPRTGKSVTLHVDGDTLLSVVQQLLYADAGAALLPPALRAARDGDLVPLLTQLVLAEKTEETISRPMQLSVLCAEDAPFFSTSPPKDLTFADFRDELVRACSVWPHAAVPPSFHDDAPTSATPSLLLAGTADPVTPPSRARAAQKTLTRSVVVTAPGLGHNVVFERCVVDIVRRFLDAGTTAGLDTSCAAKLGPFPAFLDAMGPPP